MTNLSIPEDARRILQGASDAYDEAETTSRATGPWPPAGDIDVIFKGFLVTVADFYFPDGTGGSTKLPGGLRIQCTYASADENTGEEVCWKGAISNLPPNFKETMQLLAPQSGQNSQKSVSFGLARIKGACQYVLGHPASPDLLTDIEEANDLVEAGEIIGLVVRVDAKPWKSDATKMNHTDYVNGTVDMTEVASSATTGATDTESVIADSTH